MSMSRKDYVKVASIIHTAIQESGFDGWTSVYEVGRLLADMFADDNPRFDRDRFYDAAGLPLS